TNSDGDPGRRRFLLGQLGLDAREIIVDPGEEIIRARLADSETGELSEECDAAALRWYGRLGDCLMSNVETRAVEIRLAEDLARRGPASSGAHCSPTGSGPLTVPSGSRWAPCPGLTGASYLESSITGKRR
ncbi:MAG: hypothetical protein OXG37_07365, partial [Actinomycetia bacterium]|nr:hypothetical protein [Actinomycetes bacterium]